MQKKAHNSNHFLRVNKKRSKDNRCFNLVGDFELLISRFNLVWGKVTHVDYMYFCFKRLRVESIHQRSRFFTSWRRFNSHRWHQDISCFFKIYIYPPRKQQLNIPSHLVLEKMFISIPVWCYWCLPNLLQAGTGFRKTWFIIFFEASFASKEKSFPEKKMLQERLFSIFVRVYNRCFFSRPWNYSSFCTP